MNSTAGSRMGMTALRGIPDRLRQADAWLDARGKWAWIAAMVAGFVIFFPLGLAVLAWMIWGKQMFGFACSNRRHDRSARHSHDRYSFERRGPFAATGNAAFDAYRNDTLRRLEEEQGAFESFLQRLRDARDKQEFDSFMEERARRVAETAATAAGSEGSETNAAAPAASETGEPPRRGAY